MRNFFGISLVSSAVIHCAAMFLLATAFANRPEVPVVYVSCWVNEDIAGKNAGPAVTREARSGALRNPLISAANTESGSAARAVREKREESVQDATPGAPSSLQVKENAASGNGYSGVGVSPAESGGRAAASLPVGKSDVHAFTEYAPKQIQAWRHQFMMNAEAQLYAIKARNYYKSVTKSLVSSLASTIAAERLQGMHNQSAVVEIALQQDGAIEDVLVDSETDNELLDILVEKFDWNRLPLPSRFGLADRVVKLTVTVDETGKILVNPELLNHSP